MAFPPTLQTRETWSSTKRHRSNLLYAPLPTGNSNVFDFDNPPDQLDGYASDVRSELGLEEDDFFILHQPVYLAKLSRRS